MRSPDLNYAERNRAEWEVRGEEIVAEMVAKAEREWIFNEPPGLTAAQSQVVHSQVVHTQIIDSQVTDSQVVHSEVEV
jgi:hypothetical protein